ncbi:MAG: DEAD/DEAH box helicase [Spirochaetes bacterium]|nr:DEAD/DEAH box helicase [Spirochaetota bacterium]
MLFTDLKLAEPIQKRLAEKGFPEPTPIQAETIPLALNNRDLIACAKTGSGKTLAYLLPILQYTFEHNQKNASVDGEGVNPPLALDAQMASMPTSSKQPPVALVLAPTRELVVQIADEAEFFAAAAGLKLTTIFGGVDHDKQRREIAQGPHLVVATPGRLLDFLRGGEINLKNVVRIVLDEADRMLDMGFIDDVRKILSKCSANENEERQFSLFSATINFSALYSVWEFMREPEEILINPELIDHASIEQEMLHLGQDEKLPYLIQFLEANKLEPVIIFTNSRQYVDVLVKNLNHHNIAAEGLSSMVTQNRRLRILDDFKENKFRVLVATDVASRGLHIEDIQLVVNYDIPMDSETYVHRIGRTARAGKTGKAMSFSSEFDYDSLAKLERYLKYKIPVVQPEQRFIENISFVRIVQVARQDGADHVRSANRGSGRHERGARRGERGDRGPREARAGERGPRRNDRPQRDAAHGRAEHKGSQGHAPKQRDAAYYDSRRHRSQGGAQRQEHKGQARAKHAKRDNFAIVSRDGKKTGFFGRLLGSLKSLFTRNKTKPQISERTRRLIEEERRGGGDKRGGQKTRQGRGRNRGNRRGGSAQGGGGQRRR